MAKLQKYPITYNKLKMQTNMKPTTINVQITKCPKQFEAVRIGLEATIEPNETVEQAIKAANDELKKIYTEMYPPRVVKQPEPTPVPSNQPDEKQEIEQKDESEQKEVLTFDDKRLNAIVKRMEKEPAKAQEIFNKTLAYFAPDDQAMKVLKLAAKIV